MEWRHPPSETGQVSFPPGQARAAPGLPLLAEEEGGGWKEENAPASDLLGCIFSSQILNPTKLLFFITKMGLVREPAQKRSPPASLGGDHSPSDILSAAPRESLRHRNV